MLASTHFCSTAGRTPDDSQVLAVFNGTTSALTRTLPLRSLLPGIPYSNCVATYLSLCDDTLLWSPDGRRIALLVSIPTTAPSASPQSNNVTYDLLLVQTDGSGGTLISGGPPPAVQSVPPYVLGLWDTQVRSVRYGIVPDSFNTAQMSTWGADGKLVATAGTQGSTLSAIGQPGSGTCFSPAWQPGGLVFSGNLLYATAYWAWSPDGRYLATGLGSQVVLTDPAQPVPTAAPGSGYSFAVPRDLALQALLREHTASPSADASDLTLAWNPTGTTLAALRCADAGNASLAIASTTTGHTIAKITIRLKNELERCAQQRLSFAWSPSGERLVVAWRDTGGMLLWTPPRA